MSVSNGNTSGLAVGRDNAYRVSILGYIKPILKWSILLFAAYKIPVFRNTYLFVFFVGVTYSVLYLRTYRIYANKDGIWRYRGLFPWQKSIAGVRWHNVDEALTTTGFISWASKSYDVCITNRFTGEFELYAPHIYKGQEFVSKINYVIGIYHEKGYIIEPITKEKTIDGKEINTMIE